MVERMRWLRGELWNLGTCFFTGAVPLDGAVPLEVMFLKGRNIHASRKEEKIAFK
jgi:hypothetical protein